jgi:hypothetical protein
MMINLNEIASVVLTSANNINNNKLSSADNISYMTDFSNKYLPSLSSPSDTLIRYVTDKK